MPDTSQLAALEAAALRSKDPFARLVLADALEETNPARAYAWRYLGLKSLEPAAAEGWWWLSRMSPVRHIYPGSIIPADIRRFLPRKNRLDGFRSRKAALLAVVDVLEGQFNRRSSGRRLKLPRRTSPRVWRAAP